MSYLTVDEVQAMWADAPMDADRVEQLLDAAHAQVIAYAPTLPEGAPIPANYKEAELVQVRALGQSMDRDGDVIGFGDGYAVRVRPLGADVKALLRPRRGKPRVG